MVYTLFDLTDPVQVNLEAGKEYWFFLNLNDEDYNGSITYGCGILKNGKSMASSSPQMNQKFNSGSIYIKDINKLCESIIEETTETVEKKEQEYPIEVDKVNKNFKPDCEVESSESDDDIVEE